MSSWKACRSIFLVLATFISLNKFIIKKINIFHIFNQSSQKVKTIRKKDGGSMGLFAFRPQGATGVVAAELVVAKRDTTTVAGF